MDNRYRYVNIYMDIYIICRASLYGRLWSCGRAALMLIRAPSAVGVSGKMVKTFKFHALKEDSMQTGCHMGCRGCLRRFRTVV